MTNKNNKKNLRYV